MTVETARANGIEIAYEAFGERDAVPVLLVMGLGTQMLGWPEPFCEELAAAGHRVVRFDNRDIGLSTHLHDAPPPDLGAAFAGDTSSAAYSLVDMAEDAVGLLDALGWDSAHLVGVSMGGMIVQQVVIAAPERVRSVTSIMSTPAPRIGPPTQEAMAALMQPPAKSREEAIENTLRSYRIIGSPDFPLDEDLLRERAGTAYDRAYDPAGVARQLMAIQAGGDRREGLAAVDVPFTVVHGAQDPLVQIEGGRATAEAVPGARLEVVDGMGHDLPRALWPQLLRWIGETVAAGEQRRSA